MYNSHCNHDDDHDDDDDDDDHGDDYDHGVVDCDDYNYDMTMMAIMTITMTRYSS